jgi:BNR/Asp-box repeat
LANTQVTFDSSTSNARSESNIAINPNNPLQIVSSSKKFANIETYNFTLATEYSTDGGQTWHDSPALATPGFTVMTDPTLAWDDSGNVFLVGLAGNLVAGPPVFQTVGIVVYKSTDGGQTWGAPTPPIPGTAAPPGSPHLGADRQWAAGDTNPASPYHGNVYAVWDNTTTGTMAFMRTQDGGITWIGAGSGASATAAGSSITTCLRKGSI